MTSNIQARYWIIWYFVICISNSKFLKTVWLELKAVSICETDINGVYLLICFLPYYRKDFKGQINFPIMEVIFIWSSKKHWVPTVYVGTVLYAAYTEIKYMSLSRSVWFRGKVRQVNQQVQYNVSIIKIMNSVIYEVIY